MTNSHNAPKTRAHAAESACQVKHDAVTWRWVLDRQAARPAIDGDLQQTDHTGLDGWPSSDYVDRTASL
jgi:hypothetical protein